MTIEIRPLKTIEEYRALGPLQQEAWQHNAADFVPDHVLLTVQKNGGAVLGAFESPSKEEGERLVGFAFGFVGLTHDGRIKHCSHMVGVLPAYQNQNVGYRLKLAQRKRVLAQGINLITWTFDPLESRNARLNFHKLGVTCNTYLRNLYGSMRGGLNVGLPSDRFQVDWHISSARVTERLRDDWAGHSLAALQVEGAAILNPARPGEPPCQAHPIEGERLLIQIPARFQAVKAADMELARAWRTHTRELFEAAFAAGYTAIDLLFEKGTSCYLLEKGWSPRRGKQK